MENRQKLAVVLVTYNRAADLKITITQLSAMQNEFDHLVVINNCSTDNTMEILAELKPAFSVPFDIQTLDQNHGGAGGFHAGVKYAVELPVDWIWMSDDDAILQSGSLATLLQHADSENDVYGSTAIAKDAVDGELVWPVTPLDLANGSPQAVVRNHHDLQDMQRVLMLPFLGFMVSRKKALEVGPPNIHYFISGDDVEYGIRMQASGAKLFQVRDSIVIHPRIPRYIVSLPWRKVYCLRMVAWRRYFDVRNRIWNSRLRAGYPGALVTCLAVLFSLFLTVIHEQNRSSQVSAYVRGIRDGLFNYAKSGNPTAILERQR